MLGSAVVIVAAIGIGATALGGNAPSGVAFAQGTQGSADLMVLRGGGAYIGVSIRDADSGASDTAKSTAGVVVEDVRPDSPAAKAGVQAADVIVEFDGERVRSARQFTRLVQETPPGRTVAATVLRGGQRTNVSITPVAGRGRDVAFDSDRIRADVERALENVPRVEVFPSARALLGLRVQELTPELAAYFGAKDGVLVAAVEPDSAAGRAGVRVGDVIASVNGEAIASASELQRRLRGARAGGRRDAPETAKFTLGVVREKREMTIDVSVAAPAPARRPARAI
jgi:serine protease Do